MQIDYKKAVKLSDRMEHIVAMVSKGLRVCDVGCDHGFVSIALVQRKIAGKALAMDINEGPLKRAAEHVRDYGLNDYIELRQSDGLKAYKKGEADCLIIAGMGGPLICDILNDKIDNTSDFKEIILSPQSQIPDVRAFLKRESFKIIDEDMVFEDGKFYVIMKAAKEEEDSFLENDLKEDLMQEAELLYGPVLIKKRHQILQQYLVEEAKKFLLIKDNLSRQELTEEIKHRIEELEENLKLNEYVLSRII